MKQYSIPCTEAQTKKALELGAPIEILDTEVEIEDRNIGCTVGYGGFSCQPAKLEHYLYDADGNRKEWCVILEGTEETGRIVVYTPTAEEMFGWIEEQEDIDDIEIYKFDADWKFEIFLTDGNYIKSAKFPTRKEATLASIDAALDYLTNNK